MTVYDFIYLCTEDDMIEVEIWSNDEERVVFTGTGRDAKDSEYADYEVQSFDMPTKPYSITINI